MMEYHTREGANKDKASRLPFAIDHEYYAVYYDEGAAEAVRARNHG